MPTYTASVLRHQIEFLQLVRVSDQGGGYTRSWLPLSPPVKIPAMVKPRSSRERFLAGQTASAETVLIVIRYRTGITQDMRIGYNGRQFQVVGMIDVDERHQWLEIDAEETHGE
jgi:SPP1 family predicted phage head-tail adaptor